MDENDIIRNENDNNNNKMPFVKKYLIAITVVSVILVIAMTMVGVYIGYSMKENTNNSIVQSNPTINIAGSSTLGVDVQNITEAVEKSVVQVTTEVKTQLGTAVSRGSGVIITGNGYIITNAHVINNAVGAASIKVSLYDGKEYTARDFKYDNVSDIGYIKVDADEELTPAVLGDSKTLKKGEHVVVIGNPLGTLGGSVTDGILSALDREIIIEDRPMTLLQTNAEINPGNSGGGMFNMTGQLIGIVNAKSTATEVEGIGFAIPINDAYSVFESLVEFGYVKGRIDTGIMPVNIQNGLDMIMTFGGIIGEYPGVYVYNVDNRLADKVQYGDKIVAINDTVIASLGEYNKLLKNSKVGDKVKLTIKRNDQLFYIDIVLAEYKG